VAAICDYCSLSLIMMFKAGCAGDTKGGAYGDPLRALELEGMALFTLILSAVFGVAGIMCVSRFTNRGAIGAAFGLLALVILWLAGIQLESWAVQSCFA